MRKPLGKRGVNRKTNQQLTGKSFGHVDAADPTQNPRTPKAPAMAARFLFSCGYKADKLVPAVDGWMKAAVFDRVTGEPRGVRFVRAKAGGGFECRRELESR